MILTGLLGGWIQTPAPATLGLRILRLFCYEISILRRWVIAWSVATSLIILVIGRLLG